MRFPPPLITDSGRCVFHHLHSSQRVVRFPSLAIGSAPLVLSVWVGFPLGPLPHSIRLTTAVTAINSCVTFELSTEVDSSPVIAPTISRKGSRLSPPKGPRRQLGVGSAEAFPITLQERQASLRGVGLINVSEYWGCFQPKTLSQTIISTGD